MATLSFSPNEISQPELHGFLLSAVAPRPIAFASTVDINGKVNLSPFSFFNVFSSNPPILIFSPARRGTDNSTKHTLDNVLEVKECVVNIVNYAIVEQMSLASSNFDYGVNEFLKAGLTMLESDMIIPPRVGESPVSFECRVNEVVPLGNKGGAGNLVMCEVIKVHINKDYLTEKGKLDTTKLELVGRMGEMWYVKAYGAALFEIPKPLREIGIGVDQLPENIRKSKVLSGNNIGRLGNLQELPTSIELTEWQSQIDKKYLINEEEQHKYAKELIESDMPIDGLKTLMLTLE